VKGELVQRHLSDIELLLGVFTLALITIFTVAAILDGRWRKTARLRAFRSDPRSDANYPQMSYAESTYRESDATADRMTFDSKRTFDGD
jgi:hypothetical protein